MAICELVDIAVQALGAHVVIDAIVTTLEQRPETFNSIYVRLFTNVLTR